MSKASKTIFSSLFAFGIIALYLFFIPNLRIGELFQTDSPLHQIVFKLRLPRLLFVLSIGGALSVLGGAYQVLFKNALAEPYVLGVSSSVSLAAALLNAGLKIPLNSPLMITTGCLAGLFTALFLLSMGRITSGSNTERLVLFGMSLNFVLSSLLFLFLTYASEQLGGGTMQWLFGHIPWVRLEDALFFLSLSVTFVTLWICIARHLDALSMGDLVAKTLGVRSDITRWVLVLSSSAFLGLVVTQTGAIGFVGLVVPHTVRLLFTPHSSRSLFSISFAVGGIFLLFCDFLSRNLLPPMEFPIGILTTLVGAPAFLWLLWKR